ncbi:MAG TPA: hypothetical protein VFV31_00550 [Chitinophagaceae bacterium]|nr:hypothetical protein [Chitinophagaceae bacterium]
MELTIVSLIVAALALAISLFSLFRKNTAALPATGEKFDGTALKLQAYERLILLTERISLPNLVSRLNQPGIPATDMKIILTENIKQEFEYNSTQQLYVSQVSWDAVRNLKEQNIMVINQVAAAMPPGATASELNKKILEVTMAQPNGNLHDMVLQALNFEAKKLMK